MSRCRRCETDYPEHVLICPNDGELLDPNLRRVASRDDDATVPFIPPIRDVSGVAATAVAAAPEAARRPAPRMPDDDLLPDGLVVGEYEIKGRIDAGGMAVVYAGVHPVIGKEVAIKVLSRALSSDPSMVDRFVQEARSVNQIRHHNIVDIFALGQLPDGRVYCVMELLSGASMQKRLRREPALTYEDAISILQQICDGLEAAHRVHIVHRDLKPDNVFLIETPRGPLVKLLDFGIAKLLANEAPGRQQTRAGVLIGTPEYMAPEQCLGQTIDRRTDIYALGVMMFEMFTGRLPFDVESPLLMISAQVDTAPIDPRTLGLADDLSALILSCLEKDPAARPQSVAKVRERLAIILTRLGDDAATPLPRGSGASGKTPAGRGRSVERRKNTAPARTTALKARSRKLARVIGVVVILALAALGATVVIAKFRGSEGEKPASPPPAVASPAPQPAPVAAADPAPTPTEEPPPPEAVPPEPTPAPVEPTPDPETPRTGSPATITDLQFRPTVAWVGEKKTITGTVSFEDADGDIKALGVETRGPDGKSRNRPRIPLRLSGAKAGTAAFTIMFDPTATGTHTFEVWAIDAGGNSSKRLSAAIEAMERDDAPAKADAGPPPADKKPADDKKAPADEKKPPDKKPPAADKKAS
jgi:serine/threonine protein kinase